MQSAKYFLYTPWVYLIDIFNKARRNAGRPMTNEMIRLYADGVLLADDPDKFRRKASWMLDQAAMLGDVYPELTVKWASYVAGVARLRSSPLVEDAINVVLAHAEAAYPHDHKGVRESLTECWLASYNRKTRLQVEHVSCTLEPALRPGPWGITEAGIEFLSAERERDRSLWERFGDWKYRVMHPPGPNDITISG